MKQFKKLLAIFSMIFDKKPACLISLTEAEMKWIRLCKGHYKDRYRTSASDWITSLKPMFLEVYKWDPDEHYMDFLDCVFKRLLEIQIKISDDKSGNNCQLQEVFNASFYKSARRDYPLPIERCIAELCGLIQCNRVVEENGQRRYNL